MTDKPNNPPAFPQHLNSGGLTMRDYFAAAALTGLIAQKNCILYDAVAFAYTTADIMLKAREA